MKTYGKTEVIVCESCQALGQVAARDVSARIRELLKKQPEIRMIVAAADELRRGITLTVPAHMSATHKFTLVPLATKRAILERVLSLRQSTESLPASILREYPGRLYVDRESCPACIV
jgi:6-phosphogluconolactonase/glucosamine-6-phosphate isomerase/deaminase